MRAVSVQESGADLGPKQSPTPQPVTPTDADGHRPQGWVDHPQGLEFEYLGIAGTPPIRTEYRWCWEHQRRIHALVAAHEIPDTVIYVEHDPVYTAGRRTPREAYPFDGTPVVPVDRGGEITWHGPGQLVGYPIVFLQRGIGVVDYVRRVEEAIIRLLAGYGLRCGRVPGRTGVWFPSDGHGPERKICAIGIRVSRQTALHGFALNIDPDTAGFDNIIPCGIADADVTTVARELRRVHGPATPVPSLVEVAHRLEPVLAELLAFGPYTMSPDIPRRSHPAFLHPLGE
ncbi:lipoyl(octanoyl) transferase LipB [Acidipropionibacterium virtanenii]|uniref:Octanoyltransferase n=1 Tax=Acidipropionibacterium virtanenii TaxID=2057246 RepID=A0A344UVG1_9ACTN|nr:lipoyl(octanoyl) transferase LipB [Acidipropionibacterium virtanenii]AXE39259.1 Octanoyltransferase [Acidipropionibacterium virtanenii]